MKKNLFIETRIGKFVCMIAAIFLALVTVMSGQVCLSAYAETANEFDTTNVLEDLEATTIDGKAFSLEDYAFNEKEQTTVLLLAEYCYSFYENKQGNYGLYLYVWNPRGLAFDAASSRNAAELSFGDCEEYRKYPLRYLSRSEKRGYEGLFYKYKIELTEEQRIEMLSALNSSKRVYHVSGIELLTQGETSPHDYEVNAVYEYTGYAKGYGSNENDDSLSYTKYKGEVFTITENGLRQTFYRPAGSNGKNSYTQDTLQTVYFAVPNRLFEQYGVISELRAEWLKAKTAWGMVTGTEEYYKAFLDCVGYSTKNTSPLWGTNKLPFTDYGLYAPSTADKEGFAFNCNVSGAENIPYLAYVLATEEWGKDKADEYVVSWQEISEWMKNYHDTYDKPKTYITPKPDGAPSGWVPSSWTFQPPYNGEYLEADGVTYAYSRALFESWDKKKTVVDIPRDKKLSLTSEKISQSWWQKMFGGSEVVSSTTFDDIEAIHLVAASDFKASKQLTCDGLYISLSDYDDFKKFYDTATKQDETVVLLRFDVGEYSALEASEGIPYDGNGVLQGIKTGDTNARLFQMNVYLGFDIISLTFDNGEETFVIPVVSDPIDAGGASTGALHTNSDKDNRKLFFSLLILVILLIFLQLTGILPAIVRLILWLIELPFRAIAWVFKSIGNAVKKKKGG